MDDILKNRSLKSLELFSDNDTVRAQNESQFLKSFLEGHRYHKNPIFSFLEILSHIHQYPRIEFEHH